MSKICMMRKPSIKSGRGALIILMICTLVSFAVIQFVVTDDDQSAHDSIPPYSPKRSHLMRRTENSDICNAKYPPKTLSMLRSVLHERGVTRVALAALLRDIRHVLPTLEAALGQVVYYMGAENVFFSVFESGSRDRSNEELTGVFNRFQQSGVSSVLMTSNTLVNLTLPRWVKGESGNRIEFLAALRNAVMTPLLEARPAGYFDKVFFINDVYICGGDILRLLAHDADMACGIDYEKNKVYDEWVYLPAHADAAWSLTRRDTIPPMAFPSDEAEAAKRVLVCWNGGAAFKAKPWYQGVRFRSGMAELGDDDCSQSECSQWAIDFHRMGYHNIIVDPTVQVAYDKHSYFNWVRHSRPKTLLTVQSPPQIANLPETEYRCCELLGPDRNIVMEECGSDMRPFALPINESHCSDDPARCLRYSSKRFDVKWNWRPLVRVGASSTQQQPTRRRKRITGSSPHLYHDPTTSRQKSVRKSTPGNTWGGVDSTD